jgi:hypothetical protein
MHTTFKYKGPRIAWIGNPHQTVKLYGGGRYLEFAYKNSPREKKRNQKKLDGKGYGI